LKEVGDAFWEPQAQSSTCSQSDNGLIVLIMGPLYRPWARRKRRRFIYFWTMMKLIIFDTWQVVYIHSFVPQLSMFKLSYPLIPTPRPIHALDDNDHRVLTKAVKPDGKPTEICGYHEIANSSEFEISPLLLWYYVGTWVVTGSFILSLKVSTFLRVLISHNLL